MVFILEEFKNACKDGDYEKVRRAARGYREYEVNQVDLFPYYEGFVLSCGYGHLDIAKMLVECLDLYVAAFNDLALIHACSNNHLHVVEWLLSFPNVGISKDIAFVTCCEYGSYETLMWLIETYPDIKIDESDIISASKNGHLDVVKFLISKNPNMDISEAFHQACMEEQHDVVFYLYAISNNKEELMKSINNEVSRFELFRRIIAAKRIKREWMKCYYSPYTKIGIKRLNREYDALVEEGVISS